MGAQTGRAVDGAVLRALESEFAVLAGSGALYAVLVAHPCDPRTRRRPGGDAQSSPYVQFHWRDECSPVGEPGPGIQVEVVGDRYLRRPHPPEVRNLLSSLGFTAPGVLGDDFDNWVAFRTGEATDPSSVARMLVAGLHAVVAPSVSADDAAKDGTTGIEFEWIRADEQFDLHAVLRAAGGQFRRE